jgi:hypothetical protein
VRAVALRLIGFLTRTLPPREREWGAAARAESAGIEGRRSLVRWALGIAWFWLRSWGRALTGARGAVVVGFAVAAALGVVALGEHERAARTPAAPHRTAIGHLRAGSARCSETGGLHVVAINPGTGAILWLSPGSPLVPVCAVFPDRAGTSHWAAALLG